MNKSVVKKLIQAKLLEYDALKEVLSERMPDSMKEKAKQVEADMMGIAKEIVWERMMGSSSDQDEYDEDDASNEYNEDDADNEYGEKEARDERDRGDAVNVGCSVHGNNKGQEKGNTVKKRERSKTHHIDINFGEEEK